MFEQRRKFAPVREGDELDVKIEAVGEKGDGIAKKQGFVLFIPGTKEGDEVRVRITRVLRSAGFAEVIQGASPSKKKSEPAKQESEDDTSELEAASEENDSEDFGEESSDKDRSAEESDDEPEAEEEARKTDDDPEEQDSDSDLEDEDPKAEDDKKY